MAKSSETLAPKTLTIQVDKESYQEGYKNAYQACEDSQSYFLGRSSYYWQETFISWLPFVVFMVLFFAAFAKGARQQSRYFKKYDEVIDRQAVELEEIRNTNKLLAEISQKLDRK